MTNDPTQLGAHIVSRHANFAPFAFHCLTGGQYIPTPFDGILGDTLDRVFTGDITRLIINIPPGFGKTFHVIQSFVARGFAVNPAARFIHTSYSDTLVHDNSIKIRDIVSSQAYQSIFPHVSFRQDSTSKKYWKTSSGGAFLASPAGGAITGFRAGVLGETGFSGAFLADDLVKPDDASSEALVQRINRRWESTFRSRFAHERVPFVLIMQRISDRDFTHELLNGSGANEKWHHLVLPAYISSEYQYDNTGFYIEHGLPEGALWPQKLNEAQAKARINDIQYSQVSTPARGEVFEAQWFKRFSSVPSNVKSWSIYADTASKTAKYNDYTVFQLWAKTTENHGYLVAQYRDKVKVPHLLPAFLRFYDDAKKQSGGRAVSINIEDKDSGVGLIQALELDGRDVTAIQRREGKYSRWQKASAPIQRGDVFIFDGAVGDGVIAEAVRVRADDSHAHDDQVDPLCDFVNFELPRVDAGGFSGFVVH